MAAIYHTSLSYHTRASGGKMGDRNTHSPMSVDGTFKDNRDEYKYRYVIPQSMYELINILLHLKGHPLML